MSKHTPGPWNLDEISEMVFNDPAWRSTPDAQATADARLIAAAPDLLAALQNAVNAYQQHFDVMPVAWQTVDDIARAAIAKATGGQP